MRTLRNLYHSIPLNQRIPTHYVLTLSDHWLNGYAYLYTLVLQVSTFKLLATEYYRHADTSRPIPFNSPRRGDCNETRPDSGGHLPAKVSAFFSLLRCLALRTLGNQYHSIRLAERNPTHSVPTLSNRWLKGYPYFCSLVPWASPFKLLATWCYRHADASRPIPFDSPRRADSNEALPDSGGSLPAEVSPHFFLLKSIAMCTLRNLYHSIPLTQRIPRHSVLMLSDSWLKGYPYFCT